MQSDARRSNVYAVLGYFAAAALFAAPLLPRIHTHLTGDPAGDTGVYVWNLWVFQHELLDHRRMPYFTDAILASGDPANLSLHNYTLFQNVLAPPLIPLVGIIASFNIVTLLMQVITAYATYMLAHRVVRMYGHEREIQRSLAAEAWLAGLLFAWSPVLVARGTAHFSLVAAAPLAVFLLCLRIRRDRPSAHSRGPESSSRRCISPEAGRVRWRPGTVRARSALTVKVVDTLGRGAVAVAGQRPSVTACVAIALATTSRGSR